MWVFTVCEIALLAVCSIQNQYGKVWQLSINNPQVALEWAQSNVQQNIEQLQNTTLGVTINKKSTTTEPPP